MMHQFKLQPWQVALFKDTCTPGDSVWIGEMSHCLSCWLCFPPMHAWLGHCAFTTMIHLSTAALIICIFAWGSALLSLQEYLLVVTARRSLASAPQRPEQA